MGSTLKIATIGGGSSYTPELVEGFIKRHDELPVSELWLVDVEEGRQKLETVGAMAQRMFDAAGIDCNVHLTLDRRAALEGADYVTTQYRAGFLRSRVLDERIPLSHGMIGQETNGAGGIFNALRTVPVALSIVEDMRELCPDAWLINFANPSGMVTQAALTYGGWDKVVGLCNIPVNAIATESELLGEKPEDLIFRFAGINHLHWHRVFDKQGRERTDEVIRLMYGDGANVEVVANIKDNDLIFEQVENLHMIPCSYQNYYYHTDKMLAAELEDFRNHGTRAEQVEKIEAELFDLYRDPHLDHKPQQLAERGGARYSDAACETITSLHNNYGRVMTVDTRNNGTIADLPDEAAVEVTCVMTGAGPIPFNVGHLPAAERGLLQLMKAMEELTIEAAVTGDRGTLLQAFTMNPLITSGDCAKQLMDEMLAAHREFLPQFFK